ncbi:hypothetical protein BFC17_10460 [Alteromonas lipolytica]|uniref:Uncharacterized protein n=1 Tax=Alteromonas lipolytica TaxID=1856405 RepID=A0A1E8FJF7_9ALTE|nr:hypothetical protein BFC17_10460 [Alteromonas lipolytica]
MSVSEQDIDWDRSTLRKITISAPIFSNVLASDINLSDVFAQSAFNEFNQYVKSPPTSSRVFINLDPDFSRINHPQANPLLQGEWQLLLVHLKTPNSVSITGHVANHGQFNWQSGFTAVDYLTASQNMEGISFFDSAVFVIQPDGIIQEHPIRQLADTPFKDIAPGAVIYVPFPETLNLMNNQSGKNVDNQAALILLREMM